MLGSWLLAGGVAFLRRPCRLDRAARRPGHARGFSRPTFPKVCDLAVQGGSHERSTKQCCCEEACPGHGDVVPRLLRRRPRRRLQETIDGVQCKGLQGVVGSIYFSGGPLCKVS
jgi:hypothetical protein